MDSPVIKGIATATVADFWAILWINDARRQCVPVISQWLADGKPVMEYHHVRHWRKMHPLWQAVVKHGAKFPQSVLTHESQQRIAAQIELCYTGYEMIPSKGATSRKYLFAGEAYGGIVGESVHDADYLIWDVPLCLLGHIAAHGAAACGEKTMRPKDQDDVKRLLAEANAREERGELHPWQYTHPLEFPVSDVQRRYAQCIAEYEQAVDRALKREPKNA
jgi:hypothetical protein